MRLIWRTTQPPQTFLFAALIALTSALAACGEDATPRRNRVLIIHEGWDVQELPAPALLADMGADMRTPGADMSVAEPPRQPICVRPDGKTDWSCCLFFDREAEGCAVCDEPFPDEAPEGCLSCWPLLNEQGGGAWSSCCAMFAGAEDGEDWRAGCQP